MTQRLLTTREAASYLNMSEAFLERDRCETGRIPFIRVGSRTVRYDVANLDDFIARRRRRSTADPGTGE